MIEFVILIPNLTPHPDYYWDLITRYGDTWKVIVQEKQMESYGGPAVYVCSLDGNYYRWFGKSWVKPA